MPPKAPKVATRHTSESDEDIAALALRLVELLNEDIVVEKLVDKLANKLYPRELIEKVGVLDQHVVRLTQELEAMEEMIKGLEEKVRLLEDDGDNVAQYSRRASIQVRGVNTRTARTPTHWCWACSTTQWGLHRRSNYTRSRAATVSGGVWTDRLALERGRSLFASSVNECVTKCTGLAPN